MLVKIKVMYDRLRNYLAATNTIMVGYLFFEKIGFEWWYLLFIPFIVAFIWFDARYIMPRELNYIHHKSPMFKEILNNIQKIQKGNQNDKDS